MYRHGVYRKDRRAAITRATNARVRCRRVRRRRYGNKNCVRTESEAEPGRPQKSICWSAPGLDRMQPGDVFDVVLLVDLAVVLTLDRHGAGSLGTPGAGGGDPLARRHLYPITVATSRRVRRRDRLSRTNRARRRRGHRVSADRPALGRGGIVGVFHVRAQSPSGLAPSRGGTLREAVKYLVGTARKSRVYFPSGWIYTGQCRARSFRSLLGSASNHRLPSRVRRPCGHSPPVAVGCLCHGVRIARDASGGTRPLINHMRLQQMRATSWRSVADGTDSVEDEKR